MTNVTKNKSKTFCEMKMHNGMNLCLTVRTSKKNCSKKSNQEKKKTKRPFRSLRERAGSILTIYNSTNSSKARGNALTKE